MRHNFLGNSPEWYKLVILGCLIVNPIVFFAAGGFIAGWLLIAEFIFTLMMALRCYPMQPGGLLVLEAVAIGMAGDHAHAAEAIYREVRENLPVILLLIFMVPAVYFNKEILLFTFRKLIVHVRNKVALALLFCFAGAFLSAWLDALTVIAVIIAIAIGFYEVYHRFASGALEHHNHDHKSDDAIMEHHREDLAEFRGFLQNIAMHGAVGTALGGAMTLVGEPQNLIIGSVMGWDFREFFFHMIPVTLPVFLVGLATAALVEITGTFGYGYKLPERVWEVMHEADRRATESRSSRDTARLWVQALGVILIILGLGFHIAEVGLVGLGVLVLVTSLNGVTEEHQIGKSFEASMPFTGVLVVFFVLVAIIHEQHLFTPLITSVLALGGSEQLAFMYLANAILSCVSDNVFVALTYITETKRIFDAGGIDPAQYEKLAIAINMGTNIPSIATPNGQAAFLFLLTSPLAAAIRLGYARMCWLALPYTITMTTSGLLAVIYLL